MTDLTAPVDDLNAACARARAEIRVMFQAAVRGIARRADRFAADLDERLAGRAES